MSFDRFWAAYPRRVGKIDAQKAWSKAIALASPESIIAAVEFQRSYWSDARFIPYPATWLRAGRWMDELEPQPVRRAQPWRCPHVLACTNREMCRIATELHRPEKVAV